jgi:DNA-directed RNA polymerase subunit RPC12/RpoP
MNYVKLKLQYPEARKEYQCGWCDGKILIKERHCYKAYIIEGKFTTNRMHLECVKAMREVLVK